MCYFLEILNWMFSFWCNKVYNDIIGFMWFRCVIFVFFGMSNIYFNYNVVGKWKMVYLLVIYCYIVC